MPKVSVIIVTYNAQPWIEHALESLTQQTFQNFQVLVVDNASQDQTIAIVKEKYPFVQVVQNRRNLEFSKANNQGVHFTKSDYVLFMNQDIILTETYLEKLVEYMDKHSDVGSATGKVYRLKGRPSALTAESFSKTIDTIGIQASRSRRFMDRGANTEDVGQFDKREEIFGVSAALAFYRRDTLEDVKIGKEYFDEDFRMYKEDVDLAWRARIRDWKSMYVPEAVAYHGRTAQDTQEQGNIDTAKNRRTKPAYVNINSARNHLWMLVKCEQGFWRHLPWILWYEIRKWGYILVMEPRTLAALWQFFKGLGTMKQKRTQILTSAKADGKEMRQWFT